MKLYVLFGQRKEDYLGEYGPEALGAMTEYEYSDNPQYLYNEKEKFSASKEFAGLAIVALIVDEKRLDSILCPDEVELTADFAEQKLE